MARDTEVVISRSVRVNTGKYEGTEQFVSIKRELDEFDDASEEAYDLSVVVEKAIVVQLVRSYLSRRKRMTPEEVARHHGLSHVPNSSEIPGFVGSRKKT